MTGLAKSFRFSGVGSALLLIGFICGWGQSVQVGVGYQIDFDVPASLLLPLAAACVSLALIVDPFGAIVATSVRPLRVLLCGRVFLCSLFFAGGSTIGLTVVGGSPLEFLVIMRNGALLLGLGLAAIAVVDLAFAWIPGCAYVIACMAAGSESHEGRAPWAVMLEEDSTVPAPWGICIGILIVGLMVLLPRVRQVQARH